MGTEREMVAAQDALADTSPVSSLTMLQCVVMGHIGRAVVEAASSGRRWDVRTDPVVRMYTAGVRELLERRK